MSLPITATLSRVTAPIRSGAEQQDVYRGARLALAAMTSVHPCGATAPQGVRCCMTGLDVTRRRTHCPVA